MIYVGFFVFVLIKGKLEEYGLFCDVILYEIYVNIELIFKNLSVIFFCIIYFIFELLGIVIYIF